jgi:endonuclease YncB( thermonuclease family)
MNVLYAAVVLLLTGCSAVEIVNEPSNALPKYIQATVITVADGDTITAITAKKQQHQIRVAGIDAPERGQPFGDRSRRNLTQLAHGKGATLQCHKMDRYQRKVCKVWVQPADCPTCSHTLDVGLAQITVGLAWWYRAYAHEQLPQDRGRYQAEETEARLKKRGLWGLPDPVPPWEWRRQKQE